VNRRAKGLCASSNLVAETRLSQLTRLTMPAAASGTWRGPRSKKQVELAGEILCGAWPLFRTHGYRLPVAGQAHDVDAKLLAPLLLDYFAS
jgi:hypothetical protein